MSETLEGLRRKIDGAEDLESVVRTMKALATSSIGQYERAVQSLGDYYRTVELGLVACLRQAADTPIAEGRRSADAAVIGAVVFGSDQGLVGEFNDRLADFVSTTLAALPGEKKVWAVGERVYARLADAGLPLAGLFSVPSSVTAIAPLVGQILVDGEARRERGEVAEFYLFHNRPKSAVLYEPVCQRLLPLDERWRRELVELPWPTRKLPEVLVDDEQMLLALVREYLFVLLFRACAESLASENASRLAAMQRAEKNIGDLLEDLTRTFHHLRQSSIDEELFDVISGFEALKKPRR